MHTYTQTLIAHTWAYWRTQLGTTSVAELWDLKRTAYMFRYWILVFTPVGDKREKPNTLYLNWCQVVWFLPPTLTINTITKHIKNLPSKIAGDFDWHITQISATSCFLSLIPSKKMYSLPGEWSLISCQVIVCCFHCAPWCCAAGYVVSSQSQTEVTDHLSIHQTPAAERDHLVLTKRSKLSRTQYQIS